jgi:hypothetical protein
MRQRLDAKEGARCRALTDELLLKLIEFVRAPITRAQGLKLC